MLIFIISNTYYYIVNHKIYFYSVPFWKSIRFEMGILVKQVTRMVQVGPPVGPNLFTNYY